MFLSLTLINNNSLGVYCFLCLEPVDSFIFYKKRTKLCTGYINRLPVSIKSNQIACLGVMWSRKQMAVKNISGRGPYYNHGDYNGHLRDFGLGDSAGKVIQAVRGG